MAFLFETADHEIVTFHETLGQLADLLGRILQVVIHGDDHVARGVFQSDEIGVVLAGILQEVDADHFRILCREPLDHQPAVVRARIVDQHDLALPALRPEVVEGPADRVREEVGAAIDRDHDRIEKAAGICEVVRSHQSPPLNQSA